MEKNAAQVFSENWNIYQKVVLHNYMYHAEFAIKTAAVFKGFTKEHLQILDIGCGDACTLLPVLQEVSVSSYTGYDLSTSALQLAAENLKTQSFSTVLKEGDMLELIREEEKKFDVIYSSFAIHHLQDDDKKKLLLTCFDRLLPGGCMIYIDLFRQQHVSAEQYLANYLSYIEKNWPLVTEQEKRPVCEHIRQYDFPSDKNETLKWIGRTGFSVSENYQPDHRHALLVLNKQSCVA